MRTAALGALSRQEIVMRFQIPATKAYAPLATFHVVETSPMVIAKARALPPLVSDFSIDHAPPWNGTRKNTCRAPSL